VRRDSGGFFSSGTRCASTGRKATPSVVGHLLRAGGDRLPISCARVLRSPREAVLGTSGVLFGPVWTVLYALMGIAAWLVAGRAGSASRTPLVLWSAQLGLNATWTPVFSASGHRGLPSSIVLPSLALVATVTAFFSRRPVAGVLLVPYLIWVSFATALNFAIWRRNRLASPRRGRGEYPVSRPQPP
jgi:tryptophan-rich sensory protein